MDSSVTQIDLSAQREDDVATARLKKFDELRQRLGADGQTKERTSFSFYEDGFAVGSLIEIVGPTKTTALALFLSEHPEMRVAWVTSKLTVHPFALSQKGANLQNILFVEAGNQVNWCLIQVLESGCFQVIVADIGVAGPSLKTGHADVSVFSERELRRYQLLSESYHTHFFLLSRQAHKSWVPHLQLEAQKSLLEASDGSSSRPRHMHLLCPSRF